jgi:hypothetical protein
LPHVVTDYEALLFDTEKQNLIYVVKNAGDKSTKVVVEVNYNLRGQRDPVNMVRTASNIPTHNLLEGKYILLDGAIK